jgi:hypothetical protein
LLFGTAKSANAVSFGLIPDNGSATLNVQNIVGGQGNTFSVLSDLSAASLAGIDVVWALNANNGAQLSSLINNAAAVSNFVAAGGVLLYHDREVGNAESVLPGGAGFNIIRNFVDHQNINVLNNTTTVTNGPGGVVNNATLDGGNSSSHGFSVSGSLPGTALQILSRGNPTEIVDFTYTYGDGDVYYSTIPLDHYLAGFAPGFLDNFKNIYAPNVAAFASQLATATAPAPVPEPGTWMLMGTGLIGLLGYGWKKRQQQDVYATCPKCALLDTSAKGRVLFPSPSLSSSQG